MSSSRRKLNIDLFYSWLCNQLFLENIRGFVNEYLLFLCHFLCHIYAHLTSAKNKHSLSMSSPTVLPVQFWTADTLGGSAVGIWKYSERVFGNTNAALRGLTVMFFNGWTPLWLKMVSRQSQKGQRKKNITCISGGYFSFFKHLYLWSFFLDFQTHLEHVLPATHSLRCGLNLGRSRVCAGHSVRWLQSL